MHACVRVCVDVHRYVEIIILYKCLLASLFVCSCSLISLCEHVVVGIRVLIYVGNTYKRTYIHVSIILTTQQGRNLWAACTDYRSRLADVPSNALLEVPAGEVDIVRDVDDQYTYGWDNEYGRVDKPVQVQVSAHAWLRVCVRVCVCRDCT